MCSSDLNASLTKGKSQIETSSAQLAQAQAYKEQASGVASGSTSSGINLLQSPAFAKMLPGMARDVNAALAKGDYAGAMDKIDERLAFMGLGLLQPSTAKAPSLLPSGAATPTEQSVTKAQENSAAKARGTVDPSAAYAKGKPKVDTSSVKAPAFAKDADKKIDGARDQLTEDFAETHQSNAKAIDAAKADIGVFKGKKTRDNPNGKVGTNRQTAGAVTEIAAQDVVVGGIYALSPVAGALDAVGSIVGKPNLGTDRQKLDAKRALGIDPEKLVRKKVE